MSTRESSSPSKGAGTAVKSAVEDSTATGDHRIAEFLAALGSTETSPGSGAAAAVAMALAAGCALKALAISRKHAPEDARVLEAFTRLERLCNSALEQADRDAVLFSYFLGSRDERAKEALLRSDETADTLARELRAAIDEARGLAHEVVAVDMLAADVLLNAACEILAGVRGENVRARSATRPT